MHIFTDRWQDGFLDYALEPNSYRIRVHSWCVLAPIESMYFVRPRDWRVVWNYLREDGPVQVLRKVRSRQNESNRNEKFVCGGLGEIIEAPDPAFVGRGVVFVAPAHPKCVERVVLPQQLCKLLDAPLPPVYDIAFSEANPPWQSPEIEAVKGFSTLSGDPVPECLELLDKIEVHFRASTPTTLLRSPAATPVRESNEKTPSGGKRLQGVLFGYGHYAKTNIIPNVAESIEVSRVHEVDPTQLGPVADLPFATDSSGALRPDEKFDVYFLAGFHHYHASLGAEALRRGAWAVIEKPIATRACDLDDLIAANQPGPSRVLIGFQRRYSEITRMALDDLRAGNGEPVNFFSIVHEVPLPEHHWYRWPNSCSRVLSNGCHWIDLFLFCNGYNRPTEIKSWMSTTGEMSIAIELENRAVMTLALNESGSSRIGIEEYVEMRRGDITARLTNNTQIVSETSRKILRRQSVPRLRSFEVMYREFARRIAAGEPGDSLQSLEVSGRTVLQVEELLGKRPFVRFNS